MAFIKSREQVISIIGILIIAVFFSAAQLQLTIKAFGPEQTDLHISAIEGIINGLPHWEGFQNRVLGPYSIEAMHQITGWEFETCYHAFNLLMLIIFYLILILTARYLFKSTFIAVIAAAIAGFFNLFLLVGGWRNPWVYPWDYITLIIITAIIWMVLARKPVFWLYPILLIGIFNHDLILVVAGWLALDSVIKIKRQNTIWPKFVLSVRWQQLIISLGIIVIAIITFEILRSTLLVRETGPILFFGEEAKSDFMNFFLPNNLEALKEMLSTAYGWNEPVLVFLPLLLGIPILAIRAIWSRDSAISRLGILMLLLWIVNILLSLIYETRVWLPFVPFIVLLTPILFFQKHHLLTSDMTNPDNLP